MSGPLSIRFAVSGGSATGLGHIMRCAAIASDARKRGLQVAFSLDGDEPAERTLRREVPDVQIDPWPDARALTIPLRSVAASSGPMETDETESNLVDSRHCDWVVFDTRRDLSLHLRTARSSGARTAVLDTLDYS